MNVDGLQDRKATLAPHGKFQPAGKVNRVHQVRVDTKGNRLEMAMMVSVLASSFCQFGYLSVWNEKV